MKRKKLHFPGLIKTFLQGARLKTLSAVCVPVCLSTIWAFQKEKVFDVALFLCVLFSGGFIQCAVNFFNDVLDFKKGVDGKNRKGPARLTQSGQSSPLKVMSFGLFSVGLAVVTAVPLIFQAGWPILILGLTALSCAWLYSGSPFPLAEKGISELFVVLFFGLGAVGGSYYIQTLKWDNSLIYLGLQCGLWSLSLLLINHLRDEEGDRRAGRKNWITLYGREAGLLALGMSQLVIYLFCFYWLDLIPKAGALSFLTLPGSAVLIYFISVTPPSPRYNKYLGLMSLLYCLFGLLWFAGFYTDHG